MVARPRDVRYTLRRLVTPTLGPPREGRPFSCLSGLVVPLSLLAPQQRLARAMELRQPLLDDAQQSARRPAVPAGRLQPLRLGRPTAAAPLLGGDLGLEARERARQGVSRELHDGSLPRRPAESCSAGSQPPGRAQPSSRQLDGALETMTEDVRVIS